MPYIGKKPADIIATAVDTTTGTFSGNIDVDGTTNLDVVDVDGAVDFASTTAHAGNATFADNAKAIFGAGSDLQIYHDGTDSYVDDQGTGDLRLCGDNLGLMNAGHTEFYLYATTNGAVDIKHNNITKISTTATGIDVTGISVSDGMSTNTSGTSNFIAGVNAGNSIESGGNYNVLVGDEAGTAISTGNNNTLIGYAAGDALTTGSHNTFVGENAGTATTGSNNTGIGRHALTANTSGVNTAVGYTALDANTTGTSNVAVGDAALGGNVAGDQSVAIGTEALLVQNPSGNADMNNVAVGYRSGYAVTTGVNNVLVGSSAGDALTDADENVAVGYLALTTDTLGSRSTAIGNQALQLQNFTSATETYNTAVGFFAGQSVTTGANNTLIGGVAGDAITTGASNTAVGFSALQANTTGASNVAVGQAALANNTTASSNTSVGTNSMVTNTTGISNTTIGKDSGYSNTSGRDNTLIGDAAGYYNTSGSGNVMVGSRNNVGAYAPIFGLSTADNRVGIGHSGTTNAYVQVAWTVVSDQRDKADITNFTHGLDYVNKLRPVNYVWDNRINYEDGVPDGSKKKSEVQLGFLAQEVQAVETSLGIDNNAIIDTEDSDKLRMTESKLIPVLVNAVQELSAQVTALTERLTI
jgi:trimeric autotransporter adhesin